MSDKNLNTLDVKLKEIGNRAKPFGGYSIIFSGDFRQLEPVGSTELDLLFSSLSSKHWDNCINAIIILDNNHRFKEDPEYGQMLKRMWNGDLTTEDCKRINSRVIGYNGLQLPSNIEGEFKKRKFQNWKNTQKHAITLISVFVVILNLCKRRLLLCLPNKQRTECYPCSNISEAHTINTPNNNKQ